ncbi:glucose-1-phosphate adenylyltransferase [bacterium]|nr:glucose-1-phosphate adenylyltransferase [candidate division CSSED10-310 bacterium]
MMNLPPVCMILAGGQGSRLNALAWHRAKPAVPFAGIHRLIDFTLSNAANSGLMRVGILTQYLPLSLMDHIGTGASWDLAARTRECRILPPTEGASAKDWYQGTGHAIAVNSDFISRGSEKEILILSGDHIYFMDYRKMIAFHRQKKAHFTIATMPVPIEDAHRFGIAVTNADHRIIDFQEKPDQPRGTLGSMGIYVADASVMLKRMNDLIANGKNDIGAHLVPSLIQDCRVFAYPFDGYWRDVGTLDAYWDSSMDLIDPDRSGLQMNEWNMRTNLYASQLHERAPAAFGSSARVSASFISQGCRINGHVHRSILSPGVVVENDAVVIDSVLLDDVSVGSGSRLQRVIADKHTGIGSYAHLIGNHQSPPNNLYPNHLSSGLIILGNRSVVPNHTRIEGNCLVFPSVTARDWITPELAAGSTLKGSSHIIQEL